MLEIRLACGTNRARTVRQFNPFIGGRACRRCQRLGTWRQRPRALAMPRSCCRWLSLDGFSRDRLHSLAYAQSRRVVHRRARGFRRCSLPVRILEVRASDGEHSLLKSTAGSNQQRVFKRAASARRKAHDQLAMASFIALANRYVEHAREPRVSFDDGVSRRERTATFASRACAGGRCSVGIPTGAIAAFVRR
jgi:hypothetical protein